MTNVEMIKAMIYDGMTPNDIYNLAEKVQDELIQGTKARKAFMNATLDYLGYLDPDMDISDEDIKSLEECLRDLEQYYNKADLSNPKKVSVKTELTPEEMEKYLNKIFKTLGV